MPGNNKSMPLPESVLLLGHIVSNQLGSYRSPVHFTACLHRASESARIESLGPPGIFANHSLRNGCILRQRNLNYENYVGVSDILMNIVILQLLPSFCLFHPHAIVSYCLRQLNRQNNCQKCFPELSLRESLLELLKLQGLSNKEKHLVGLPERDQT